MIELMVVVGVMGAVMATAALMMPDAIKTAKADSGLTSLVNALQTARDMAVAQRRDMEVRFVNPREIDIYRYEVPSGTETLVQRMLLDSGLQFVVFASVPDTPDGLGKASATAFGTATTFIFRSEALFTDANTNLDPISGTVFIGVPGDPTSARAATILGATALITGYRWNGSAWVNR